MLVLFVLFLIPIFVFNKSSQVLTRLRQENVFYRYYPFAPREILDLNKNVWLNWQNNPVYYFLGIMAGHMLSYFSPINLGGRVFHWVQKSVQYIPSFSMVGWMETIVFIVGLIYLIKDLKNNFRNRFLIYWILSAAAPAALTWNWFHPLRSMNLYPAIELVIFLGFVNIYKIIKNNFIRIGFVLLFVLSILFVVD